MNSIVSGVGNSNNSMGGVFDSAIGYKIFGNLPGESIF
jgi:hypothetical protein